MPVSYSFVLFESTRSRLQESDFQFHLTTYDDNHRFCIRIKYSFDGFVVRDTPTPAIEYLNEFIFVPKLSHRIFGGTFVSVTSSVSLLNPKSGRPQALLGKGKCDGADNEKRARE